MGMKMVLIVVGRASASAPWVFQGVLMVLSARLVTVLKGPSM